MTPLRVGIIGCGLLARVAHIPVLKRTPSVEIVGLCDSSSDALANCASLVPNALRFDSVDALINSHTVDAVVISLPSHLHTDAALTAHPAILSALILCAQLSNAAGFAFEALRRAFARKRAPVLRSETESA
ncbi:MAG: Gfo/Idh/MocA family oxidoreductase [Gemmatimonadales bacterium]